MINLNLSDTVNTESVLDGWKPRSMGKRVFLEAADFTTENTFGHPENIRIVEKVLGSVKANFEYSFPPHSTTILDLRKSDGPSTGK